MKIRILALLAALFIGAAGLPALAQGTAQAPSVADEAAIQALASDPTRHRIYRATDTDEYWLVPFGEAVFPSASHWYPRLRRAESRRAVVFTAMKFSEHRATRCSSASTRSTTGAAGLATTPACCWHGRAIRMPCQPSRHASGTAMPRRPSTRSASGTRISSSTGVGPAGYILVFSALRPRRDPRAAPRDHLAPTRRSALARARRA